MSQKFLADWFHKFVTYCIQILLTHSINGRQWVKNMWLIAYNWFHKFVTYCLEFISYTYIHFKDITQTALDNFSYNLLFLSTGSLEAAKLGRKLYIIAKDTAALESIQSSCCTWDSVIVLPQCTCNISIESSTVYDVYTYESLFWCLCSNKMSKTIHKSTIYIAKRG